MSVVESGIDNGGGEALGELAGIKKEGNEFLGFFRIVALEVGKRVRLFVARSVGGGGGDGFTENLNKLANEGIVRETNTKSMMFRFKSGNDFTFRFRDNSNRTREKVLIDVFGCLIKFDIVFGHDLVSDGDRNGFTLTITFEIEKLLDSLGISSISTDTIAGFGRVNDEVSLLQFFDCSLDCFLLIGSGEIDDLHGDIIVLSC